jgi:mRNA interferase RelE/StbE
MIYQVTITKSAEKEIADVPKVFYPAVKKSILDLSENPRPAGVKKLKGFENTFRIRVGVYRIIYLVEDKIKIVTVTRVAHRKDAY